MAQQARDPLTLVAVGDVILTSKDYQLSFARAANILKEADIAFLKCMTPYAESGSASMAQHGAVPHDSRGMPALLAASFDVCNLANSRHTGQGGTPLPAPVIVRSGESNNGSLEKKYRRG